MNGKGLQYIGAKVAHEADQFMFKTGLLSPVLMELAAQSVAHCASHLLERNYEKKIGILCGPGSKVQADFR